MGSFPLFQTRPEFVLNKIGKMIIVEALHASAFACIVHLLGLHLSPLCKIWKGIRFSCARCPNMAFFFYQRDGTSAPNG